MPKLPFPSMNRRPYLIYIMRSTANEVMLHIAEFSINSEIYLFQSFNNAYNLSINIFLGSNRWIVVASSLQGIMNARNNKESNVAIRIPLTGIVALLQMGSRRMNDLSKRRSFLADSGVRSKVVGC